MPALSGATEGRNIAAAPPSRTVHASFPAHGSCVSDARAFQLGAVARCPALSCINPVFLIVGWASLPVICQKAQASPK